MRISIVSAAVAAFAIALPGAASAATTYTFTEYPVPAGAGLRGLASGPDGALWFGMPRRATVRRMTTTGRVTEYPLPTLPDDTRFDVYDITAGPDGARQDRVTPAGGSARSTAARQRCSAPSASGRR